MKRIILLNPDAPTDELAHELADHLVALAEPADAPVPGPARLVLVHSADEPEEPAPSAAAAGRARRFRVAE